jgi:heme exporter protein B
LLSAGSIFRKDWKSEIRTRYAISALVMFVVSTIAIVLFSVGGSGVSREVLAGMLWVVIFFSSMSGLSRTFVTEEERGTAMTLHLLASPGAVLAGKLVFNLVLVLGLNLLAVVLYSFLLSEFVIANHVAFWLTVLLGSAGLASAATIIAAIIAKANTKGTLFPVLSLPILLPLLVVVINATSLAQEGAPLSDCYGDFQFLVAYIVVVVTTSSLLFDYIWKD